MFCCCCSVPAFHSARLLVHLLMRSFQKLFMQYSRFLYICGLDTADVFLSDDQTCTSPIHSHRFFLKRRTFSTDAGFFHTIANRILAILNHSTTNGSTFFYFLSHRQMRHRKPWPIGVCFFDFPQMECSDELLGNKGNIDLFHLKPPNNLFETLDTNHSTLKAYERRLLVYWIFPLYCIYISLQYH